MVTYRKARPDEREAYIKFANMVFGIADVGIDFEKLIPKVYGAHVNSADMHNIAVDDEKGIRGLVAVMPNELQMGDETLKIGFIGSVSVHPEARSEGHMKALMKMSLEQMLADDVDIAFLGGQRQRYEYFGYAKGGVGYTFDISKPNVRHALKDVDASAIVFEEIKRDSSCVDQACQLFEEQPIRFHRKNFIDCCQSYFHRPWAVLKRGEFIGYIVASMKKDGIAEIRVKSMTDLDVALKAWVEQNDTNISVTFPEWEKETISHLNLYAENVRISTRVQASVLKPRRVLKAMLSAKAAYTKLENASMSFEIEGDRFTVTVNDGKVEILDGGENPICLNRLQASQLFVYPFDYEGRIPTPGGWFPLPVYEVAPDAF